MLDMAPARGGRVGQVIEWRHDTNERRLVAPSLEALLKQTAEGLEAGRFVYDGEAGVRRAE
jgi:cell wall assembly regulator SMI1